MVQSKMRFYKQGSRSGSCALYLSLWHKDIFDFLELTLPIGDEQLRARDLFTAVIINDLFMEKLEKGLAATMKSTAAATARIRAS
jgi:ribonucleotide reductase alpha subunit